MLGVILFALFSIAAGAAAVALADSFVRGRDAFVRLHRELAQAGQGGRIFVSIESFEKVEPRPAARIQVIRRTDPRRYVPIRAAAQPTFAAAA